MEEQLLIQKTNITGEIDVAVPGSKSITNRALLLAALSSEKCTLHGVLFSEDSRAFLSCLVSLGFDVDIDETTKIVKVAGMGGSIPNKTATINVCSAGTAARFLTVMLAFAGGEYTLNSSAQMEKRPMEPLLSELRAAGVEITCLKNEGCFPFILKSNGITKQVISIDTEVSSQFASALLMSAPLCKNGLHVHLTGNRVNGAYIQITRNVMTSFGVAFTMSEDGADYDIQPQKFTCAEYDIEPDLSAAGYFFAAGALLGNPTTVKGVNENSMQGDKKLLGVLSDMGATITQNSTGTTVKNDGKLHGVTVNMNDFSDQALTLAAIAPFATSPTTIEGIGHIRKQECDRIHAMVVNLTAMGVKVEERESGITIYPCEHFLSTTIETFNDHRVAMSFAIAGLKAGGLTILNPKCCKKTFENFFDVLQEKYF